MDEEKKDLKDQKEQEENKAIVPEEDKQKKKTPEDVEKEMEQMLKDLSDQMGVDKNQIRVVSIKAPKRNFKVILFESLYYLIFY